MAGQAARAKRIKQLRRLPDPSMTVRQTPQLDAKASDY
jgi:hypothetical protein